MDKFRLLLINTPYMELYGPDKFVLKNNFPLGASYLSSFCKKQDIEVCFLDPEAQGQSQRQVVDIATSFRPQLIGFSSVTFAFPNAVKMARVLKDKLDNVPVVVGGIHASAEPVHLLEKHPELDFVVFGEGEYSLMGIIDYLMGNKKAGDLKGVTYRRDGVVIKSPPQPAIENVDDLPFPDRDSFTLDCYRSHPHRSVGKIHLPMITSRGCPHHCIFCASYLVHGRRFRGHSAEYVLEEIELLIRKYKVHEIYFQDDHMTVNKNRAREIFEGMLQRNLVVPWCCNTSIACVDKPLLDLMKRAGCIGILFGLESGNAGIMSTMGKGKMTKERSVEVIHYATKIGIRSEASFIIGFPNETRQTAEDTIKFAVELNAPLSVFQFMTPYPGTKVYEDYKRSGKVDVSLETLDDYKKFSHTGTEPFSELEFLTKDELKMLLSRAYRKFYLRPGQLLRLLIRIRSFGELRMNLLAGWAVIRRILSGFIKTGK